MHFNKSLRLNKQLVLTCTLAVSVMAVTLTLSGCSKGGFMGGEKVATVDGVVITKSDYDKAHDAIIKVLHIPAEQGGSNPMMEEMLKRMTLSKLIMFKLIQLDASKNDIRVTPEEFKSFKDKQIKLIGGEEAFKKLLAEAKMTENDFNESLQDQALIDKFLDKKGGSAVQISEQDAKAFYDTHPTEFNLPEMIKASHILLKAIEPEMKRTLREKQPNLSEDQLLSEVKKEKEVIHAKALDLFKQVNEKPDQFAALAKKHSEDIVSATNGGNLDKLQQQSTDPAFWAAAKKTKPGTLYPGVLETQFGYHILRVNDHIVPHKQSFEEAKASIIERMAGEKKQAYLQNWWNEKRKLAKIEIEKKYQPQNPQMPPVGTQGNPNEAAKDQGPTPVPSPESPVKE